MNPIKIQLYQSAKDNTGAETDLQQMIETIAGRTGASANIEQRIINIRKYKQAIEALENNLSEDPEEEKGTWTQWLKERTAYYEDLKKGLPAVTWSGTFTKRAAKNLKQYSQLICIDIDKLASGKLLEKFMAPVRNDKHTFLLFVSPSGNGFKVILKVDAAPDNHKDVFLAIEKYFINEFQISIDASGKDISRLCFLSYDENLYHNPDSSPFILPAVIKEIPAAEQKKLSQQTPAEKKQFENSGTQINDIWESTQQVIQYTDGNRNNFIYKFACNCNRVGFTQSECEGFAAGAAHDLSPSQVTATVKSAYNHNAAEHGKYKRNATPAAVSKKSNTSIAKNGQQPKPTNSIEPDYIFWKEHTTQKGKGKTAYTVSRFEIVRREFLKFLFSQGFHLLQTSDSKGKEFVYSSDGIIKPVDTDTIKHHVITWCKKNDLDEVEEMLLKGQTKYFSAGELTSLQYKEVQLKRDTEGETYFYFDNCWVVIDNVGNVTEHEYKKLDTSIWESNKIKFDYKPTSLIFLNGEGELLPHKQINCEFTRFVALASHNPKGEEERHFTPKQITDRFFCFCSAIGFLLDGYKHPGKRKAIFAVDHKICERMEAHGRTGKSLIPQACQLLKCVANINGKKYDPDYQFCDELITVDTQIINFNDMKQKFDVEHIFEKITDPYSVNRRNNGYVTFKYENSPKVYYSTNFTPKGEGASYKARMHVIEFSDYFNDTHSPYDEFGHGFFDASWDTDEWQRFYNFMLWCVSYYKENGLQDYPMPNIEARKLVYDVVTEFVDYMEDTDLVQKNIPLQKKSLLIGWNKEYQELYGKTLSANAFYTWVKKFCSSKGYTFNPKQNGKYDKRNKVEYYTIADEHWKDEQQTLLK